MNNVKVNNYIRYESRQMYLKKRERINSIWYSIFSWAGLVALMFSAADLFVIYDMIEQVSIGRIITNLLLALVLCVSENFLGIIITRYSYDEKYKLDSKAAFYKTFFSIILVVIFCIMIYFRYEFTFETEHNSSAIFSTINNATDSNVSTFLLLCAEPIISTLITMWIAAKTSDRLKDLINLNEGRIESLQKEIADLKTSNSIIEKSTLSEEDFIKEQTLLNRKRLDAYIRQIDLQEERLKLEARQVLAEKLKNREAAIEILNNKTDVK